MSYSIRHLSFGYSKEPVLRSVSLDIEAGEFAAVVGPNGAGKSTLLRLMAGLLPHFSGSIDFMSQPILGYKSVELARRLAFVPQETHVVFPFTTEEIILMGRLPYKRGLLFDSASDSTFVERAMKLTETEKLSQKMFGQLSGGERQRVVLASALAQTPEVLLLDEPTVYLDVKHQLQFYEILHRLNRQDGMTVIAVTHDINLAARYTRRMIALRQGTIVADGSPNEVLTVDKLHEIFEINADIVHGSQGGTYVIPSP